MESFNLWVDIGKAIFVTALVFLLLLMVLEGLVGDEGVLTRSRAF